MGSLVRNTLDLDHNLDKTGAAGAGGWDATSFMCLDTGGSEDADGAHHLSGPRPLAQQPSGRAPNYAGPSRHAPSTALSPTPGPTTPQPVAIKLEPGLGVVSSSARAFTLGPWANSSSERTASVPCTTVEAEREERMRRNRARLDAMIPPRIPQLSGPPGGGGSASGGAGPARHPQGGSGPPPAPAPLALSPAPPPATVLLGECHIWVDGRITLTPLRRQCPEVLERDDQKLAFRDSEDRTHIAAVYMAQKPPAMRLPRSYLDLYPREDYPSVAVHVRPPATQGAEVQVVLLPLEEAAEKQADPQGGRENQGLGRGPSDKPAPAAERSTSGEDEDEVVQSDEGQEDVDADEEGQEEEEEEERGVPDKPQARRRRRPRTWPGERQPCGRKRRRAGPTSQSRQQRLQQPGAPGSTRMSDVRQGVQQQQQQQQPAGPSAAPVRGMPGRRRAAADHEQMRETAAPTQAQAVANIETHSTARAAVSPAAAASARLRTALLSATAAPAAGPAAAAAPPAAAAAAAASPLAAVLPDLPDLQPSCILAQLPSLVASLADAACTAAAAPGPVVLGLARAMLSRPDWLDHFSMQYALLQCACQCGDSSAARSVLDDLVQADDLAPADMESDDALLDPAGLPALPLELPDISELPQREQNVAIARGLSDLVGVLQVAAGVQLSSVSRCLMHLSRHGRHDVALVLYAGMCYACSHDDHRMALALLRGMPQPAAG